MTGNGQHTTYIIIHGDDWGMVHEQPHWPMPRARVPLDMAPVPFENHNAWPIFWLLSTIRFNMNLMSQILKKKTAGCLNS